MTALRCLLTVVFVLICGVSRAQTTPPSDGTVPDPILRVAFEETEAIPGQPLVLRLTVLVPTNLTSPPVWPTLETPDLLVRLPERSTGPTSERIDGQTWAGVTRRYQISPMVPGDFVIPSQTVSITWSSPSGRPPIETDLNTEAFSFRGILPEGAEGLDPFFAARGLTVTSQVAGSPDAMKPGDSLTWTVSVSVEGTSPMFLPSLVMLPALPGLKAYPDDPRLEEKDERGKLTGTRTEVITFVAEGGGSGALPEVTVSWFNIATGTVETATTEAVAYAIEGPAAASVGAPRDIRSMALLGAVGALALVALWLAWRLLSPRLRRAVAARHAAHLASEDFAWSALRDVLKARDRKALYPALDLWAERHVGPDPRANPDVKAALHALGRASFGENAVTDTAGLWSSLSVTLQSLRRTITESTKADVLPPLNPSLSKT